MIDIQINPTDLREFNRDMQAIRPKKLVGPELDPLGKRIIRVAKQYPASVGYPRTGRLGRSWYHHVFGLDLKIGNSAYYAGYVHGPGQIQTHRKHGWKRVLDVMSDEMSKFMKKIEDKLEKIWR
jgi:hypothetical protein